MRRWIKLHRPAFDFALYKLPAKLCSGILYSVIFSFCSGVRGTMYRDDLLSHVLCMMFLLVHLSMMYTFLSSESAKHPLSQNMPIERSALFFLSGKMCACCALMGTLS